MIGVKVQHHICIVEFNKEHILVTVIINVIVYNYFFALICFKTEKLNGKTNTD